MYLDYDQILHQFRGDSIESSIAVLQEELPWIWRDAYVASADRVTNIMRVTLGTFEYLVDDYQTLENKGVVARDPTIDGRLIAVHGLSAPRPRKRDDHRLRKWVGPTHEMFGDQWDKGHFMGHALGGAVEGFEANVFVQRRDLNRGWSAEGKRFRSMERHCLDNPGTFCFCRPLYADQTCRPGQIEFGLLRPEGRFWVDRFVNTLSVDDPGL